MGCQNSKIVHTDILAIPPKLSPLFRRKIEEIRRRRSRAARESTPSKKELLNESQENEALARPSIPSSIGDDHDHDHNRESTSSFLKAMNERVENDDRDHGKEEVEEKIESKEDEEAKDEEQNKKSNDGNGNGEPSEKGNEVLEPKKENIGVSNEKVKEVGELEKKIAGEPNENAKEVGEPEKENVGEPNEKAKEIGEPEKENVGEPDEKATEVGEPKKENVGESYEKATEDGEPKKENVGESYEKAKEVVEPKNEKETEKEQQVKKDEEIEEEGDKERNICAGSPSFRVYYLESLEDQKDETHEITCNNKDANTKEEINDNVDLETQKRSSRESSVDSIIALEANGLAAKEEHDQETKTTKMTKRPGNMNRKKISRAIRKGPVAMKQFLNVKSCYHPSNESASLIPKKTDQAVD